MPATDTRPPPAAGELPWAPRCRRRARVAPTRQSGLCIWSFWGSTTAQLRMPVTSRSRAAGSCARRGITGVAGHKPASLCK